MNIDLVRACVNKGGVREVVWPIDAGFENEEKEVRKRTRRRRSSIYDMSRSK